MLIFSIILLLVLGFGVKLYAQDSTQTKPTTELAGNLTTISADTLVSDSISAQIQQIKDEYQEAIAENTKKMDSLKLWLQILSGVVGLLLLLIAIVFIKLSKKANEESVEYLNTRIENRKNEIKNLSQKISTSQTKQVQTTTNNKNNGANGGNRHNSDHSPYQPKPNKQDTNPAPGKNEKDVPVTKNDVKTKDEAPKVAESKITEFVKPGLSGDNLILIPTSDSSSASFMLEYPSSQKGNPVIIAELVPKIDFVNLKTLKIEVKKSLLDTDTSVCDWSSATDYTIIDSGKAIKTPDAWKMQTAIKIKLMK